MRFSVHRDGSKWHSLSIQRFVHGQTPHTEFIAEPSASSQKEIHVYDYWVLFFGCKMRSRLCINRTESQKAKHVLCADNRMLVRKLMNVLHQERENHRNVVDELRQLITEERRNCNEFLREMHTILTDIAADKRLSADCDDDCTEVSINFTKLRIAK